MPNEVKYIKKRGIYNAVKAYSPEKSGLYNILIDEYRKMGVFRKGRENKLVQRWKYAITLTYLLDGEVPDEYLEWVTTLSMYICSNGV